MDGGENLARTRFETDPFHERASSTGFVKSQIVNVVTGLIAP